MEGKFQFYYRKTIEKINLIEDFSTENIEHTFKDYITENELGMGAVLPCMRLILTGKGMGPSVFAIASLLGKDEVMTRYQNKIKFFTSLYENKKAGNECSSSTWCKNIFLSWLFGGRKGYWRKLHS